MTIRRGNTFRKSEDGSQLWQVFDDDADTQSVFAKRDEVKQRGSSYAGANLAVSQNDDFFFREALFVQRLHKTWAVQWYTLFHHATGVMCAQSKENECNL